MFERDIIFDETKFPADESDFYTTYVQLEEADRNKEEPEDRSQEEPKVEEMIEELYEENEKNQYRRSNRQHVEPSTLRHLRDCLRFLSSLSNPLKMTDGGARVTEKWKL